VTCNASIGRQVINSSKLDENWRLSNSQIDAIFESLGGLPLTRPEFNSLNLLRERLGSLEVHRRNLARLRTRFREDLVGDAAQSQLHSMYDASMTYFQSLYSTVSSLFAVALRYSAVFGRLEMDGVEGFLRWLARQPGAESVEILESARALRALMNHPHQHGTFSWNTSSIGGTPAHVVIYGAEVDGVIPSGAEPIDFADGPGWYFVAPYDGFTSAILLRAVRSLIERIATASVDGDTKLNHFFEDVVHITPANGDLFAPPGSTVETEYFAQRNSWPAKSIVSIAGAPIVPEIGLDVFVQRPGAYKSVCLGRDELAPEHVEHRDHFVF